MKITRANGAGNTFFILSDLENKLNDLETSKIAKFVCGKSFFNFETDGLFVLKKRNGFDFEWSFFNKDGSTAEMCGNAARCAVLYYSREIDSKKEIRFLAGLEKIEGAVIQENEVVIKLRFATDHKQHDNISSVTGLFVNTGVPHFVVEGFRNLELAKKLRSHALFGVSGTNVTFIEHVENNSLSAVTFERGVEDYTMACGTGALAAAEWLKIKNQKNEAVKVKMPGGALKISWTSEGVLLQGPAELQFTIEGENIDDFKI